MLTVKPPTTYEQQIEKLRSRGCIIQDEASAAAILSKVNYYRLTAYSWRGVNTPLLAAVELKATHEGVGY